MPLIVKTVLLKEKDIITGHDVNFRGSCTLEVAELCKNHLRGCKPDAEHREKAAKDSRHSWIRTKMKMEMRVRERRRMMMRTV